MPSNRFNNYWDNANKLKNKDGMVYYWYGASLLLLDGLTSNMHKHYPIEMYIGLNDTFQVNFGNGWYPYRAVIIDSNQPHQIDSKGSYLVLILLDPNFYKMMNLQSFETKGFFQPSDAQTSLLIDKITRFSICPRTCTQAKVLINEIVSSIFGQWSQSGYVDSRINTLLNRLEDISQEKITLSELAQTVNLSESRLAHLFKEQTGTPIRRYLLWLKLRHAIKMIVAGSTFTDAAHQSGFADSAHLSRTYRQMFGVSPSELLKSYQPIKIISSFD